jgi:hypothetical protein
MEPADPFLASIRERLGNPKRKLGFFKPSPLEFPEPPWLKNVSPHDDQTKLIFHSFKDLWKHGVIVWGYVIRANTLLYSPGDEDSPGTMIFCATASDASSLQHLPLLARRLQELRKCRQPLPGWSQKETEWWEDLNDDMSYQKGVRLPAEWQPLSHEFKGSSVLFHRPHLLGSHIQSLLLPILLDPVGSMAQVIPHHLWPDGLAAYLIEHFGTGSDEEPEPFDGSWDFYAEDCVDEAAREKAYSRVFGPINSVLHELIPGPDHIDVYSFQWPAPRNEHGYVTGGMSNLLQPDGGQFARIELVFYSKRSDPRFAKLLQVFAHYPWQTGALIGPWDTVPLGDHADAVLGTNRFPALMFFPGVAKPESPIHESPAFAEPGVRFLTVVPITQSELELKLNSGAEALIARIQECRFDLAFDPERPSMV